MSKQILLTGAAGFVGHHVLRYFLENTSYGIVCLVRLNNAGNLRNIAFAANEDRVKFIYHDLKFIIHDVLREEIGPIDYILHLGANSHVDRSVINPREFFEDNIMGTVNLLDFMRLHHPQARLINFSTDEVYGPAPQEHKFKEFERFRPSNPYSASKAAQIEAGYSYFTTFGLDIISTFTMNIFGPNQHPEKLIPKAMRYAKKRKEMPVFAELHDNKLVGVGSRHWLHVSNIGPALDLLLRRGIKGEYYNIGGTEEFTNEEVVLHINKILGTKPLIKFVDFHKCRPGHDRRYALDSTKFAQLGFVPITNFYDGLLDVIKI